MSEIKDYNLTCPVPELSHSEITLAHGGGGALTHQLIDKIFKPAFFNDSLEAGLDGAMLNLDGSRVAFTTDSYVVSPCFFPGGDIGAMAVNGTVNDLSMSGARPLYLSVALILEEGLPIKELHRVIQSMSKAANMAGVQLVTGDTKVVDRGHGDGIFINTSGVGLIEHEQTIAPESINEGDQIIISGDVGRHGTAIMSVREGLKFQSPVLSDCAAVNHVVQALIESGIPIHCMRDPTRGGVATTLVEIARQSGQGIEIDETVIPICEAVRGACELLGLDPLYVANEGCFVLVVPKCAASEALKILHEHEVSKEASVIGIVTGRHPGALSAITPIGSRRALDMLSGEQLPRIC